MRTIVISSDKELRRFLQEKISVFLNELIIFDKMVDPLDLLTDTCKSKPSLIIIDDDLIKPNTLAFIRSIKKFYNDTPIIFITSDNSIEFGREITKLGVTHYSIKPCNADILFEFIKSINKQKFL